MQHDPITQSCIWAKDNRAALQQWLSTTPTIQGSTYSPRWLDALDESVDRWRGLYRAGARDDYLSRVYIARPIEKIRKVLESNRL